MSINLQSIEESHLIAFKRGGCGKERDGETLTERQGGKKRMNAVLWILFSLGEQMRNYLQIIERPTQVYDGPFFQVLVQIYDHLVLFF